MPTTTTMIPSRWLAGVVGEAAGVSFHALSAPTQRHVKSVFADTVAAIAGGARVSANLRYAAYLADEATDDRATIIGPRRERVSAEAAAFANATAGVATELDEGVRPTGHPAVHVVPAALAVGQSVHASGDALLDAFVAGYEVAAALYAAFVPDRELHPHGTFGAIGAAVSSALLIGADPELAAAVAGSLPLAPMWSACLEGATARNMYAGHACALGVRCAALADAGFTPSSGAFDVAFGSLLGRLNPDRDNADHDRGELRMSHNYFKLHSACVHAHAAMDASLALGPIDPAEFRSARVRVPSVAMRLSGLPTLNPLAVRFSLPYLVAVALVSGHTDETAIVPDDRYLDIAHRVTVDLDPEFDARWPHECPARVTVLTTEGTREAAVTNHHGHYLNPVSPDDRARKFERLAAASTAEGSLHRLSSLEQLSDVAGLFNN